MRAFREAVNEQASAGAVGAAAGGMTFFISPSKAKLLEAMREYKAFFALINRRSKQEEGKMMRMGPAIESMGFLFKFALTFLVSQLHGLNTVSLGFIPY